MAARALAGLASDESHRQLIARAGGVRFLMQLLMNESLGDGPRAAAAMALANLSLNGKNRASLAEAAFVGRLAGVLGGDKAKAKGSAIREASKMLWLKLEADPALRSQLAAHTVDIS
jgi:hypothetical protein